MTFVSFAGEANDDNSLILANRPTADNVVVLTNKDNTDENYLVSKNRNLADYPEFTRHLLELLLRQQSTLTVV